MANDSASKGGVRRGPANGAFMPKRVVLTHWMGDGADLSLCCVAELSCWSGTPFRSPWAGQDVPCAALSPFTDVLIVY